MTDHNLRWVKRQPRMTWRLGSQCPRHTQPLYVVLTSSQGSQPHSLRAARHRVAQGPKHKDSRDKKGGAGSGLHLSLFLPSLGLYRVGPRHHRPAQMQRKETERMSQKFSSDKMFIKKMEKLSKFSYYSLNHHLSVTRVGMKKNNNNNLWNIILKSKYHISLIFLIGIVNMPTGWIFLKKN